MTHREEIVGVIRTGPGPRLLLDTRLGGVPCVTDVVTVPVQLVLDDVVRDALCLGRGTLAGLPAVVAQALAGYRGGPAPLPIASAGVARFRVDGLIALAGAYGHAYVTVPAAAAVAAGAPSRPQVTAAPSHAPPAVPAARVAAAPHAPAAAAAAAAPDATVFVPDETMFVSDEPPVPRGRRPGRAVALVALFVATATAAFITARTLRHRPASGRSEPSPASPPSRPAPGPR